MIELASCEFTASISIGLLTYLSFVAEGFVLAVCWRFGWDEKAQFGRKL